MVDHHLPRIPVEDLDIGDNPVGHGGQFLVYHCEHRQRGRFALRIPHDNLPMADIMEELRHHMYGYQSGMCLRTGQ
jgi:hypothetical protein